MLLLVGTTSSISVSTASAAQPNTNTTTENPAPETGRQTNSIIVTGQRKLEKNETRQAVRDIAMRGRNFLAPIARYQQPLCASVVGLGPTYSAQIKQRIDFNTREAMFAVGDDGCEINALVIIVDDQKKLIEELRENQPRLFNLRISRRIKAAFNRNDAAISWASYRIKGPQGGASLSSVSNAGNAGTTGISENAGYDLPQTKSQGTSRYKINYSTEKIFTVIVFDVKRLSGVHLHQIADFATMRILADPQPRIDMDDAKADTILTLFDAGPMDAPKEMTRIDRAFLRGLYAMRPNDAANRLEAAVLEAYADERSDDPD